MLELKTKWMTNNLAKASMLNKEGIACESGNALFIIGYGNLTSSGKNTYKYEVRDSEGNVIASGNDTYLDKLTNLIKGASPKAKASKGANDNNAKAKAKASNDIVSEYKRLEENLRKAILAFNDFKLHHGITSIQDARDAKKKAMALERRKAQDARREEVAILKRIATLRKWAKETKRLDLLQALNEKMLSI